jgi:hypothetical protein
VLYGSQVGLSAAGSQRGTGRWRGAGKEGEGCFGAALASVPIPQALFSDGFRAAPPRRGARLAVP